jgi:hypothetical protein
VLHQGQRGFDGIRVARDRKAGLEVRRKVVAPKRVETPEIELFEDLVEMAMCVDEAHGRKLVGGDSFVSDDLMSSAGG